MDRTKARTWLDGILTVGILILLVEMFMQRTGVTGDGRAAEAQERRVDSISLKNARFRGSPSAPLKLLVVEDFRCPACGLFDQQAMPTMLREYVDTGELQMAVLTLPLPTHGEAAAEEARLAGCADRHGKFWEYREAMLGRSQLGDADGRNWLLTFVGATEEELEQCSNAERPRVLQAMQVAKNAGVTGTPYFFLGTLIEDDNLKVSSVRRGAGPGDEWLHEWLKTYQR